MGELTYVCMHAECICDCSMLSPGERAQSCDSFRTAGEAVRREEGGKHKVYLSLFSL